MVSTFIDAVFSVNLVFKEELNLILLVKVRWAKLRGTDSLS